MNCCQWQSNGQGGGGSIIPPSQQDGTIAIFDLRGAAALVNGARVFTDTNGTSLNGTVGNTAAAATFALQAAGLRFIANVSNTAYNSATQTASFIEFLLDDVYTTYDIDASVDLMFAIRVVSQTYTTANVSPNGLNLGIRGAGGTPSNSVARYKAIRRGNLAGAQALSSVTDNAAGSAYTTAPASTTNVYAIAFRGGGIAVLAGIWGGSWDTTFLTIEANSLIATSTTNSGFRDRNNVVALSFSTGNAAADMDVTVEQFAIAATTPRLLAA